MQKAFQEIELLIENGELQKADDLLAKEQVDETIEFGLLLGKLKYKQQQWGKAINAYLKVLSIDKENREAKLQIDIIRNILNFNNPEMFNP